MDQAYGQLRAAKVKHVSTGPQTLPAWNTAAAGIKAFYFRDPEDHVLEIIFFPPGKGDPKWQINQRSPVNSFSSSLPRRSRAQAGGREGKGEEAKNPQTIHPLSLDTRHPPLFLGIDHTAIAVSDTDKSLAFYRDLL